MSVFASLIKGMVGQTVSSVGLSSPDKLLGVTDKLSAGVNKLAELAKREAKLSSKERELFHKDLEDLVIQYKLTSKLLGDSLGSTNKSLESISDKILSRDKLSSAEGSQLESLLKEFTEKVKTQNKLNPSKSINSSKIVGEYGELLSNTKISLEIRKGILEDLQKFVGSQSDELSNFKASDLSSNNISELAKIVTKVESSLREKDSNVSLKDINDKMNTSLLETHEVHNIFSKMVGKSGKTFSEAFKNAPSQFSVGGIRQEAASNSLSALGLGSVDKLFNLSGKADSLMENLFHKSTEDNASAIRSVTDAVNRVDDTLEETQQFDHSNKGQLESINAHLSNLETMNPSGSGSDSKTTEKSLYSKVTDLISGKGGGASGGIFDMGGKAGNILKGAGVAAGAYGLYDAISDSNSSKSKESFFGTGQGEGGLVSSRAGNYAQATASGALMGAAFGPIGAAIGGLVGASTILLAENKETVTKFFSKIGDGFNWLYENVALPMIGVATTVFSGISKAFSWYWENIVSPTLDVVKGVFIKLGEGISYVNDNVISPTIEVVSDTFTSVSNSFSKLYDEDIAPVVDTLKSIFGSISSTFTAAWDWFSSLPGVSTIIDSAKKAGKWISTGWDSLRETGRGTVSSVGNKIENTGVGMLSTSPTVGSGVAKVGRGVTSLSMNSDQKSNKAAMEAEMAAAGITDPSERAMFLAQVGHESGNFKYNKELGNDAYFRKYEGRKDLGNTQQGDGAKYKGRGFIQLTGRSNYARAGKALRLDLINHPELAEIPQNAAKIAIWYWKDKKTKDGRSLSDAAKAGDVKSVTKAINGGYNGLAEREANYANLMGNPSSTVTASSVSPTAQPVGDSSAAQALTLNNTPSTPQPIVVASNSAPSAAPKEEKAVSPKTTVIDDFGIAFFNSALFG